MIGQALFALLSADPAVAALVDARIYPLIAPQSAPLPRIVYTGAGGIRWNSIDGPSGLGQPRVQIDAYAATYGQAHALAKAIRDALDGYRGTAAGVRIGGVSCPTPPLDFYEADVSPPLYRVGQDFLITHDE